jgi:nucleoside-diphosphate-sugar epimerase
MDWRDSRVLVTGARGFIASHLCRRLGDAGAIVFGASRVPAICATSGIHWLTADLSDATAAHRLLTNVRPDLVFHLAGHVTGAQLIENVEPTFLMNLASTVHLLTAAAQTGGCRVVLAGSMHEPHPGDPLAVPPSPYAASKWACTGYARMFHALYGVPVVIARPFMVYGPQQWDLTKLLPYVIVSLLKGESPRVSSGLRALDWVYVDDVVEGLLVVAGQEQMDARTIDLGTGTLTSIRSIVDGVAGILGSELRPQYGAVDDRRLEHQHAADAESTQRLTGWSAKTPLELGLRRTVEWFQMQLTAGLV